MTALSKLCSERLPAMSWTRLKTSGSPFFKTPGRFARLVHFMAEDFMSTEVLYTLEKNAWCSEVYFKLAYERTFMN